MASTGAIQRWQLPDDLTQQWNWQAGDVIQIGDAMIDAFAAGIGANGVARPASYLGSLGTETLDQANAAAAFIGFSQQAITAQESVSGVYPYPITVRTQGVALVACPSQTFIHGQLMGIYSNGTAINPQMIDACGNVPGLALGGARVILPGIGIGAVNWLLATTQVVVVYSAVQAEAAVTYGADPNLFGMQRVVPSGVLTDANQLITLNLPQFLRMVPTSPRTVTLPLESVSDGFAYLFYNASATSTNVTFVGSTTALLGNGVVPQGKQAIFTCDGGTWFGLVSA